MAFFPLSANYYDILLLVFGDGVPYLSQGEKEGQREKFKEKESPYQQVHLGGVIPIQHSSTFTYLYQLRQGGSYTKWPLMPYLIKEF